MMNALQWGRVCVESENIAMLLQTSSVEDEKCTGHRGRFSWYFTAVYK